MGNLVKSIEIIDDISALEELEKPIRDKGFSVYQVGDRVLYAVGDSEEERESLTDVLEENAFVLNLDYARAKVVYLHKSAGKTADSKTLIERFASDNEIDEFTEGIPVSLLPELIEYIGENPALVSEEITEMFGADAEGSEPETDYLDEKQETDEIPDDFDDDFVDDVALSPKENTASIESVDEGEPEDTPEDTPEEILEDEPKSSSDPVLDKEEITEEEEKREISEVDADTENIEKENTDFLMEKAIALFDSHQPIRLPEFDELTHKELQEQVLEAQFTVAKARDKGINAIYNRLKDETAESIETIETFVIKKARESHEEVLNKIDRNLKYDIDKLLNEREAEYEKDRENYVQSQIPVLRKQYDAEHYAKYQNVLSAEIDKLRRRSNKETAEEKARFQEYIEGVFSDSKEKAISSVGIEDIIGEYNKTAEEQKELLKLQAKNIKKEIGSTITDIVSERDQLKEQLNQFQAKLEAQKHGEQERIKNGVSVAVQEKERKLVKENKEKLDKAYEKEQKLLRQIEILQSSLASEKENRETLKREYIEPAKESMEDNHSNHKDNRPLAGGLYANEAPPSKFGKVKLIVGGAISVAFLAILTVGVFTLNGMKNEMAKENDIQQSMYLAQLEADGRYDKVASEMAELGYSEERIAEMYLDNSAYIPALETDTSILPAVYTYAEESENPEEQQQILEDVKQSDLLDENQLNGLDVRMAIIEEDTEAVLNLTENTDDTTAKEAVRYLIDQKAFDEAENLLKEHQDDELYEELKTERKADLTEKVEVLKEDIQTLNADIEKAVANGETLEEELDGIKKSKKKTRRKKQKEIDKNSELQETLQQELEEKQNQLAELEKEL